MLICEILEAITYHFQDSQGRKGGNDYIEEGFQRFVLFMEELLVSDAQEGQEPDSPPQLYGDSAEMAELEPGCVGASYEQVDHGPITPMQQVSPYPGTKQSW